MITIGRWYDAFRESAVRWALRWFGHLGEVVMFGLFLLPDLMRLMVHLIADTRVVILDKLFVIGVLVYIISPIDLFPEFLAGPFGLVEDLILALIVLYRFLGNPANHQAIWDHWQGDPRVMRKLQQWSQSLRRLRQK